MLTTILYIKYLIFHHREASAFRTMNCMLLILVYIEIYSDFLVSENYLRFAKINTMHSINRYIKMNFV